MAGSKLKINKKLLAEVVFEVAFSILALVGSQFVIAFPMVWILGKSFNLPIWTLVYYILSYGLALWLIFWVAPRLWQKLTKNNDMAVTTEELGVKKWPTFVDIGLAPIGYIVYLFGARILTSLMELLPWFQSDEAQDVGFSYLSSFSERIIAFIAIVVIAPIAEELIMRGFLYGKLRNRLKMMPAMLLISVLFGLLHGQWNVGVATFAMSMVLCSMREMTGSIWSGMLLHMLSNGVAFYLIYSI